MVMAVGLYKTNSCDDNNYQVWETFFKKFLSLENDQKQTDIEGNQP